MADVVGGFHIAYSLPCLLSCLNYPPASSLSSIVFWSCVDSMSYDWLYIFKCSCPFCLSCFIYQQRPFSVARPGHHVSHTMGHCRRASQTWAAWLWLNPMTTYFKWTNNVPKNLDIVLVDFASFILTYLFHPWPLSLTIYPCFVNIITENVYSGHGTMVKVQDLCLFLFLPHI